ncbi:unnamed protein product, partial [Heterosigma akashiwo]
MESRLQMKANEEESSFFVMVNGQIESGDIVGKDNLYAKYAFSYGSDWSMISGMDAGLSQIARRAGGGPGEGVVW